MPQPCLKKSWLRPFYLSCLAWTSMMRLLILAAIWLFQTHYDFLGPLKDSTSKGKSIKRFILWFNVKATQVEDLNHEIACEAHKKGI